MDTDTSSPRPAPAKAGLSRHEREALYVLSSVALIALMVLVSWFGRSITSQEARVVAPPVSPAESLLPHMVDLGTMTASTDLPADLPVENSAGFEQNYHLQYLKAKQGTVVFRSTKTMKENYALYLDYLKTHDWSVVNTYQGDTVSSLYAATSTKTMNITISTDTTKGAAGSQVSVSIANNS